MSSATAGHRQARRAARSHFRLYAGIGPSACWSPWIRCRRRRSVAAPALALAFRSILEPPAIALDNALSLQKAEAVSVTDDLTGLYNSRYLNLVLRRESKRASRSGRPLSLLFLDLDGFKQVNDRHGHLAGSKALVEAAEIIRGCARETDVAPGSAATSFRGPARHRPGGRCFGGRAYSRADQGVPVPGFRWSYPSI